MSDYSIHDIMTVTIIRRRERKMNEAFQISSIRFNCLFSLNSRSSTDRVVAKRNKSIDPSQCIKCVISINDGCLINLYTSCKCDDRRSIGFILLNIKDN